MSTNETIAETSYPVQRSSLGKLKTILAADAAELRPRLYLANFLMNWLPINAGNAIRTRILRAIGFRIGGGTIVRGKPRINGDQTLYSKLQIGRNCQIDNNCTFDLKEQIVIGDQVTIGHETMLLTSSHEIGPKEHRAGDNIIGPITIKDGAWIGARCIVLPNITIGAGAIIESGSLVNKDVPDNVRVAGTPAKQVEQLNTD